MLKNNKLLYILPEMSFTATVGETPKQDYYFVQTFHQINGEFMRDENFIHESLKKLFERVEEAQYTLVLPDFLFTDTIVNVPETDDVKIAQYLRDQLLPRIEVSTFSHETRTSVLLQRKTTAKVQLSAFEKELAASLKLAIGSRDIVIDEIVPLSWALKAAVSLEPSLTIAQVGERLYLAEHYIGINQTISTPINDLDVLAESVRTLKGSDPNLQTTYLFTSELVEEKLKKFLLKTLPVQQLTEPIEEEAKIPPYVKQIIEVTARTLSLTDFAVPRFTLQADDLLGQIPSLPVSQSMTTETKVEPETSVESIENQSANAQADEVAAVATAVARSLDLEATSEVAESSTTTAQVAQSQPEVASATSTSKSETVSEPAEKLVKSSTEKTTDEALKTTVPESNETTKTEVTAPQTAAASLTHEPTLTQAMPSTQPATSNAKSQSASPSPKVEAAMQPQTPPTQTVSAIAAKAEAPSLAPAPAPTQLKQPETPVLSQPAKVAQLSANEAMPRLSFMSPKAATTPEIASVSDSPSSQDTEEIKNDKTSIKNDKKDDKISPSKKSTSKKKGSMSSFIKKLLLFLLIFVIVIAIGIGVGVLILSMSDKDFFKTDDLPEPEMSALPTPEPEEVPAPIESSPEAEVVEPEEEIDPAEFSLKVVNATGVAGLAGKAKTALESAGFSNVQTGNAAGEYETEGTFVLMKEKNSALIKVLEQATERTMNYDEDVDVEDKAGSFDAVIVLNEE